jgi:hypothetical protein
LNHADETAARTKTMPEPGGGTVADPIADAAEIAAACAAFMPCRADHRLHQERRHGREGQSPRHRSERNPRRCRPGSCKLQPKIEAAWPTTFIAQGKSLAEARNALFEEIVAKQSPEVSPHVAVDTKPAATAWTKQVDRINARTSAAS